MYFFLSYQVYAEGYGPTSEDFEVQDGIVTVKNITLIPDVPMMPFFTLPPLGGGETYSDMGNDGDTAHPPEEPKSPMSTVPSPANRATIKSVLTAEFTFLIWASVMLSL